MSSKIFISVEDIERQGNTLASLAERMSVQEADFKKYSGVVAESLKGYSGFNTFIANISSKVVMLALTYHLRFGADIARRVVEAFKAADENTRKAISINKEIISSGGDSYKNQADSQTSQQVDTAEKVKEYDGKLELQEKYDAIKGKRKDPAYEGWCANLVTDQLAYQGLIKDTPADGKDYAGTLIRRGKTDTGATVTGYASLDDLINRNQQPITNVVCSFKGGWTDENVGHVMLISKIEDGKLYFMDNRSTMSVRTGDRHLIMQCMSLKKFKKEYYMNITIAHVTK